ncbi:MAG: GNAT family N-acetyltransferase [Pseudomonadota bacterium]|nr:GNAT family N-acetyltransferase [Pseudomonadota bacterium]
METERLLLRGWQDDDFGPFSKLNGDPDVMEFFPDVLSKSESDRLATRLRDALQRTGWGIWAVELKSSGEFIGAVGLQPVEEVFEFFPGVEVAWRLDKPHWGKGYATEAAGACLHHAKRTLNLRQIVSFTAAINVRSIAVMKKIGMSTDGYEFDHPAVCAGSPLRRHVLYRIDLR